MGEVRGKGRNSPNDVESEVMKIGEGGGRYGKGEGRRQGERRKEKSVKERRELK